MTDETPPSDPLSAFLLRLPILGYAARCLDESRWGELALLALNLVMALVLAGLWWGPAVITIAAEIGTVLALLIILSITGGRG